MEDWVFINFVLICVVLYKLSKIKKSIGNIEKKLEEKGDI